jgi:hypothetical protein
VSDFVETTIASMMRGTLDGMRAGAERDHRHRAWSASRGAAKNSSAMLSGSRKDMPDP